MSIPKTLPTTYKGVRFKSRTEARWAVFFDLCLLTWDYEPEGFKLSTGETYLPDFFLPEMRLWIEVKPDVIPVLDKVLDKARTFVRDAGRGLLIVRGQPRHKGHLHFSPWHPFSEYLSEFSHKYTVRRHDGNPHLYVNNGCSEELHVIPDPEIEVLFARARGHVFKESRPNR